MKPRTLVILLGLLIVLAGLAFLTNREARGPAVAGGPAPGEAVFPGLDVNAVTSFTVTRGEESTEVRRQAERWTVPALYGYPADYAKLSALLLRIAELEVGQVVRGGADTPEEFGLSREADPQALPTEFTLSGGDDAPLATLLVGDTRRRESGNMLGSLPDGQYLRADDGPVILVEDNFEYTSANPQGWLRRDLFGVAYTNVQAVSVEAEATTLSMTRSNATTFVPAGLAEDEQADQTALRRLARAFRDVELLSVADPGLAEEAMGLADPAATVTVSSSAGPVYTISFGAAAPDTSGRYASIEVSWDGEGDAPPAIREQQALFDEWTYILSQATYSELVVERDSFILEPQADEAGAPAPAGGGLPAQRPGSIPAGAPASPPDAAPGGE